MSSPARARTLVTGSAIMSLGNSITVPFLAIYLRTELHVSISTVGLLLGCAILFAIIGGFLGGALSDSIGRRPVMVAAILVVIASFAGLAIGGDVVTAFVCTATLTTASSSFSPVAKVLLSDLVAPADRPRWFSYQYLAINAGYAIGPLLGTAVGLTGDRTSFVVAAGIYALYLPVVVMVAAPARTAPADGNTGPGMVPMPQGWCTALRRTVLALVTDRRLAWLLIAAILLETVHNKISVLLAQHFAGSAANSAYLLGAVMTTNAVAVIGLQTVLARHMSRFDPLRAMTAGGVLTFAGMAGFAVSAQLWHYVAAMVVFTLGEVLIVPSEFTLLDRIAPADLRGGYFGAQTLSQLGGFTGPYFGSLILSAYGGTAMFLAIGSLALVSVVIYVFVGRQVPTPSPVAAGTPRGETS
ncbi:MDR family MFS transporter [Catenuloplanes japonicus]|uniref:MDR family MFS transporter n=1 Tax=Catenuloplanes japonicus TaxID=33876 RepID=UPI000527DAEF|nr:MFS transporter [Catenuloplanes japonicus]